MIFFQNSARLSLLVVYYHLNLFTDNNIDNISIERDEIISLIRNLNPNKATGSDGIPGQMLLLYDNTVALPLKIIFQNILETSTYPDLWKLANVIPIFKKGDKQLIKNYRSISLHPICGKIFEKIIFNNLYSYFNANYIITISKAFDKVWHDGLRQNGISGRLLLLLENYLQNRKQRVVLNGSHSDYSKIDSGVPQGSVLGPLLFLIYINDLERNISSNIKFFADDSMLFSIVKDPVISANDLNHDLDVIYQWVYRWKMEFNPDPTKHATEILFTCKKSSPNHPQLIFNGTDVVNVSEHKHLGLILEPGLSFEKHLSDKISK